MKSNFSGKPAKDFSCRVAIPATSALNHREEEEGRIPKIWIIKRDKIENTKGSEVFPAYRSSEERKRWRRDLGEPRRRTHLSGAGASAR